MHKEGAFLRQRPLNPVSDHRRGFTLLELLWVLFILAILLSIVVPNFSGVLFQIGLEKKSREVFAAFAYVQQQALNHNNNFGLIFDLTEGSQKITCYWHKGFDAYGAPIVDPNNVLMNPLTHRPYLITLNQEELSSDARITEADFGESHWVEFNSLGEPNLEGRIIMEGTHSSYTITVSRIGRLTMSGH